MPTTIADALRGVRLVGIDTSPIIYYVEKDPTFFDASKAVFQAAEAGTITLLASTLTYTETLTNPLKTEDRRLAATYRRLLMRSKGFRLSVVSQAIAEQAALLRVRYNLKTPDALHVATAIVHQCDVFLTNDAGIQRVQELPILLVSDLQP